MNDQEFVERASIVAMQGLITEGSIPSLLAVKAVLIAEVLLSEVRKKEYSNSPSLEDYIQEIDEIHGKHAKELFERVEQLEYKMENCISHIEGIINTRV